MAPLHPICRALKEHTKHCERPTPPTTTLTPTDKLTNRTTDHQPLLLHQLIKQPLLQLTNQQAKWPTTNESNLPTNPSTDQPTTTTTTPTDQPTTTPTDDRPTTTPTDQTTTTLTDQPVGTQCLTYSSPLNSQRLKQRLRAPPPSRVAAVASCLSLLVKCTPPPQHGPSAIPHNVADQPPPLTGG